MARFIAVLDANILFQVKVVYLVLGAATEGLFQPRWSEDIEKEWVTRLNARYPADQIERRRLAMNSSFPGSMLARSAYEQLEPGIQLPDPKDVHVLAAAIAARADVIVTYNLSDFPDDRLAPYGIEAQHPDEFLLHQMTLAPGAFLRVASASRRRFEKPPLDVDAYLDGLRKIQLNALSDELEQYAETL